MKSRHFPFLFCLALAWQVSSLSAPAAGLNTFDLVKEGDKFIAAPAKDKITQIRSEKSGPNLVPDVWYIDYFDITAAFKSTEVKFAGGKMESVKQPKRFFDSFGGTKQLAWKKVKVDAKLALAIALKDPSVKGAHLRSVQFALARTANGSTWKIRFWAAKAGRPDDMIDIGEIDVSSKTGEMLKSTVRL